MIEDHPEPLLGTQLLLSQTAVANSKAHLFIREMTVTNLDLSWWGILSDGRNKEHCRGKPRHLNGVPSYLSEKDNRVSLTWADCWMG
jgi:hypothetical protein